MISRPITVTGVEQKKAWQNKVLPPVEQLRPQVWSIPVPFPGNPLRYTLSYLFVGRGEAILVDPGWDSEVGLQHLADGLRLAGLCVADITGIVATHIHSDHLGMAARLRKASGAWVALGDREILQLPEPADFDDFLHNHREELRLWGVPAELLPEVAMDQHNLLHLQNLAVPDLWLADGSSVPAKSINLHVVSTPGHTPGHICLIDKADGLIFSGDHVLPRISPHIALERPGPANPLADYYESLERIAFEDQMEVCPAHEYRFSGMQRRVGQLLAHNRARSAEILEVVGMHRPGTIWDIAARLTWSRGWEALAAFSLRLAVSETASHIVYLQAQGHMIEVPVTHSSTVGL